MAAPAPNARRAAFAASLWQFPRRLVHPLVLTFLTAALFSYLAADTVWRWHGTRPAAALFRAPVRREKADAALRTRSRGFRMNQPGSAGR